MELNTSILALYLRDPTQYGILQLLLAGRTEDVHVSFIEDRLGLNLAVRLCALGWKQIGIGGSIINRGGAIVYRTDRTEFETCAPTSAMLQGNMQGTTSQLWLLSRSEVAAIEASWR